MTESVSRDTCLGATYLGDGEAGFLVWAPLADRVDLHLVSPTELVLPMEKGGGGYFRLRTKDVPPGSLYLYRLDGGKERPDPASRYQPQGVHGPSQAVESDCPWDDECWSGLPIQDYIIYELHTGVFTPEGTFDAIIPRLDGLKDLGVTALELMPVAQFPGARNWGYDGVYPFAVQTSYGGPEGLKRLVNACHQRGLAVVIDVVYNHLGPEGNYLGDFGPYFTDRYRTPWGPAMNYDGSGSDEVRRFFIENALYWVTDFHFDAIRLDAVHGIFDQSAHPFLQELTESVHRRALKLNRQINVIAESSLNDTRLIRPGCLGGFGMDAQWNDDFHHSLHVLLTGERAGYYQDFGSVGQLAKAFRNGYVYEGQNSKYRGRRHGNSSRSCPAYRFVVCSQNHDQVGNRALSERLSSLVSFEALKLAACAVVLSPFVPLLFMGEEYGEPAPFLYFISHLDPQLVEAVRRGRRAEFAAFQWTGESPDPQAEETFQRAKLDYGLRGAGQHRILLNFCTARGHQ
ncbi:MAG: malto-oligosyltrehalose trehalohydrolase, partial [Chloroflexi bacterium]|nr:malto-oligosyltrehalose trehalohydrolase [Chloroflexota bacterium]